MIIMAFKYASGSDMYHAHFWLILYLSWFFQKQTDKIPKIGLGVYLLISIYLALEKKNVSNSLTGKHVLLWCNIVSRRGAITYELRHYYDLWSVFVQVFDNSHQHECFNVDVAPEILAQVGVATDNMVIIK